MGYTRYVVLLAISMAVWSVAFRLPPGRLTNARLQAMRRQHGKRVNVRRLVSVGPDGAVSELPGAGGPGPAGNAGNNGDDSAPLCRDGDWIAVTDALPEQTCMSSAIQAGFGMRQAGETVQGSLAPSVNATIRATMLRFQDSQSWNVVRACLRCAWTSQMPALSADEANAIVDSPESLCVDLPTDATAAGEKDMYVANGTASTDTALRRLPYDGVTPAADLVAADVSAHPPASCVQSFRARFGVQAIKECLGPRAVVKAMVGSRLPSAVICDDRGSLKGSAAAGSSSPISFTVLARGSATSGTHSRTAAVGTGSFQVDVCAERATPPAGSPIADKVAAEQAKAAASKEAAADKKATADAAAAEPLGEAGKSDAGGKKAPGSQRTKQRRRRPSTIPRKSKRSQ